MHLSLIAGILCLFLSDAFAVSICDCKNPVLVLSMVTIEFTESISLCKNPVLVLNDEQHASISDCRNPVLVIQC